MRYLLDTHVILWTLFHEEKLSLEAKSIILDRKNKIYVSAVSFWEISIKFSISKLEIYNLKPEDIFIECQNLGFNVIDLEAELCSSYHNLNIDHHKDPFDRMLIWQAISDDFLLISKDKNILKYKSEGLKTIW